MNNGIILFDIDKTLYNPDIASKEHNDAVIKLLGITDESAYYEVKEKYKKSLLNEREYNPETVLGLIAENFNFKNVRALIEVYYGEKYRYIYEDALFADVCDALKSLVKNYRLGIFSEGSSKFQNNKFHSLGLDEYFDPALIFINDAKDTLDVVSKIPKGVIIVDDKESICNFLDESGIKCIWLNRKDNRVSGKYPTIHNLLELPNLLLS